MAQPEHIEAIEKRLWNAADTLRANSNYASNEYSQNDAYFITLCTHNRNYLLGRIADGTMRMNDAGKIIRQCWDEIPIRFPHMEIDEFIVMPKHFHGIMVIDNCSKPPLPPTHTDERGITV